MKTATWRRPITRKQVDVLKEDQAVDEEHNEWIELLRPVEKTRGVESSLLSRRERRNAGME